MGFLRISGELHLSNLPRTSSNPRSWYFPFASYWHLSSFLLLISHSFSSFQDFLRSVTAWSNFLEHMHANPDVETILRPRISLLEHTVVSQDEVIASLTQELSNLKDKCKALKTKARVLEASSSRIPMRSSESCGGGELPNAEWVRLTAESDRARQEVERLSAKLSSLRDEKLTLVANLNSAILAKETLVAENNHLVAERDTTFAEKEHALINKD